MGKGTAKSATHHEFPVITIKQIGKQYNITGMDVRQAKAKLEALGFIEPLRKGSHTYRLLKVCIPHTLTMLDEDYVNAKHTYTLPDDYPAMLQSLADLIKDTAKFDWKKQGVTRNIEQPIKDKFIAAQEIMQQAYEDLKQVTKLPVKRQFVCIPIHDDLRQGISRQKRLENLINLLECVYNNLYKSMNYKRLDLLRVMATAIDSLKDVTS